MNAQELYEEWTAGEENGLRPQRVKRLRDDFEEAIGLPVPRRVPEIENWLDVMQSQVTRKLGQAAAEFEEEEES